MVINVVPFIIAHILSSEGLHKDCHQAGHNDWGGLTTNLTLSAARD